MMPGDINLFMHYICISQLYLDVYYALICWCKGCVCTGNEGEYNVPALKKLALSVRDLSQSIN